MKLDILAIGVHPDDIELSASGTLLKHIEMGYKVGLLDLTRGELGSRGTAKSRDKEAKNAAKKMGALVRENAKLPDGFIDHSKATMLKIIPFIRKYQPDIILANALDDRHPDHGRAAKITADACFLSGLLKIKTKYKGKAQKKWRPKVIYHYIQDQQLIPDFVVDITPYQQQKIDLILTFKTQFFQGNSKEYKDEVKTPISGEDFINFMNAKGRVFGRSINAEYAEGFNISRIPGVNNLFDLS